LDRMQIDDNDERGRWWTCRNAEKMQPLSVTLIEHAGNRPPQPSPQSYPQPLPPSEHLLPGALPFSHFLRRSTTRNVTPHLPTPDTSFIYERWYAVGVIIAMPHLRPSFPQDMNNEDDELLLLPEIVFGCTEVPLETAG